MSQFQALPATPPPAKSCLGGQALPTQIVLGGQDLTEVGKLQKFYMQG